MYAGLKFSFSSNWFVRMLLVKASLPGKLEVHASEVPKHERFYEQHPM